MVKSRTVLIASLFASLAGLLLIGYLVWFAPANFHGSDKNISIARGKTLSQIATDLHTDGLVRSSFGLRLAWRITGVSDVKAGSYALSPKMDAWDIAHILGAGETINFNVTFPEGYTVAQIAASLQSKGVITDAAAFANLTKNYPAQSGLLSQLPAGVGLEGYLFPDTYNFFPATPSASIIDEMLGNFVTRITPLQDQVASSGMTLSQVVTLASLVEKEAKSDADRKLVAGVLENRLNQNMRLDVDATTRYATGNFDKPLTSDQLASTSPYNTRNHNGLPPGPICNPGLAAIQAVLSPTKNDYLYYLTGSDGVTHYAKTLDEHNQNKAKYL